jgi:adenylate cyclase class IV
MENIKRFIKKYWFWIISILILFLIIILVILLYKDGQEEVELEGGRVESPYHIPNYDVRIEIDVAEENFKKREPIIEVSRLSDETLRTFLTTFVSKSIQVNRQEDLYYVHDGISVSFSSEISFLRADKKAGNWLVNYPLLSTEDIGIFLLEYFKVQSQNEILNKLDNGYTQYQGNILFEGVAIGTPVLEGYSYSILVDNLGELVELEILILQESDISSSKNIYTSSLSSLLKMNRYPMDVHHRRISESLYEKSAFIIATVRLSTFYVKKIDKMYIFNSFDTPYVYPTYRLSGDGVVEDFQGDTYWSYSEIYICAIDPEYLYDREVVIPAPSTDPAVDFYEL